MQEQKHAQGAKVSDKEASFICQAYIDGETLPCISKHFNRSKSTISSIINKAGICRYDRKIARDRKKDRSVVANESVIKDIFKYRDEGLSRRKIVDKIGVARWTIDRILSSVEDAGDIAKDYVDYTCNENAFENIDNHEAAYWLGFLAADGNITDRCLRVRLARKDEGHLYKLRSFLQSDNPITNWINDRGYDCCGLGIYSRKIVSDLKRLGFSYNKTFNLSISNEISKDKLPSYILGVFDGDGSFSKVKPHVKFSVYNPNVKFSICGCKEHIEQIQSILMKSCALNKTKIQDRKTLFVVEYQGCHQIRRICDFMYNNNVPFLERKRNVVKEIYGF